MYDMTFDGVAYKALWACFVLLFLCVFYSILLGVYNVFFHPLRSHPGPLLWRAYQWPVTRSTLKGRFPFDVLELHKKYGHVVRVAPGELCYTDSRAVKTIYGHHLFATEGYSEFSKDWAEYIAPANGVRSMLTATPVNHSRFRKLLSHSFSERGMKDLQPRVHSYVNQLIEGLKEVADTGGYTNISERYNWTTFDMIGDLAFGESYHCLENKKTDPGIAAIFASVKIAPFIAMSKRYGIDWLLPLITPKSLLELREKNVKLNREKIERRLKLGTNNGDFWDNVIQQSDFEKGTGMSKEEMVAHAFLLVLGGSETSASLLSGTTYYLLKNPETLKKLNSEVRNAFKHEDEIDLMSVSKLDYMLAVLDEGLRVYPPVPNQGNRVVPEGGAEVAGKWVSGGTSLQVMQYAANHSPSNFVRPDDFVPERWLSKPPKEFENDDRAARVPFSMGPRNCIGRNLAYAEMRLILAKVCFNFDLELDEKRCNDWVETQKIYGVWEKGPLWVKLSKAKR